MPYDVAAFTGKGAVMTTITLGEEPVTTFKQAVERVAAIAHAKLPAELHGHLERGTALVIHRHVWLGEDGRHAQVLSSDGSTWYLVNGNCTCMDAPRAPQSYCKHKLAVMLYRRASELLAASACGVTPAAAAPALPEAPASVNVRLCISGADVQWTLRDVDEHRLSERLEALLTRFPQTAKTTGEASAPQQPQTPGAPPVCPHHGKSKESTKATGTFFCPSKMADGTYCQWRHPAK
jgi:hypothetical protein